MNFHLAFDGSFCVDSPMKAFDLIVNELYTTLATLPDKRTGANVQFPMQDIGLTAFAVFFMQSPSFLSAQESLQNKTGKNNLKTLFRVERIPSENHVRALLDPINPDVFHPVFDCVYEAFKKQGVLEQLQGVNGTQYIALDGTQIHSSNKIGCDNCLVKKHKNGTVSYHHNAITPVIVSPTRKLAIPLRIEFLTPQDGHDKQDCEIAAAKRWLDAHGEFYNSGNTTLLGDDLYAHQPFCRRVLLNNYHFIFVCNPLSHTHLYGWIDLLDPNEDIRTQTQRIKNAFVTDHEITEKNAMGLAEGGRSRWKIENENNNTLKTKGYHLEHNFGHGKENLCSVLASLNILAFLMHTFMDFNDRAYQRIRLKLRSRKKFFEHVRVLTSYQAYSDWEELMRFMMRGLEIAYNSS